MSEQNEHQTSAAKRIAAKVLGIDLNQSSPTVIKTQPSIEEIRTRLAILHEQIFSRTGKQPTRDQMKAIEDGASPLDVIIAAGLEKGQTSDKLPQVPDLTRTQLLPQVPDRSRKSAAPSQRKPNRYAGNHRASANNEPTVPFTKK